jgi:hypothetical protein
MSEEDDFGFKAALADIEGLADPAPLARETQDQKDVQDVLTEEIGKLMLIRATLSEEIADLMIRVEDFQMDNSNWNESIMNRQTMGEMLRTRTLELQEIDTKMSQLMNELYGKGRKLGTLAGGKQKTKRRARKKRAKGKRTKGRR